MATADTSIYSRNPLRSVADYESELNKVDAERQSLMANRLAMGEKQRAIANDLAMQETVKGFGADTTANYNALLQNTGNLPAGQAYQKSLADIAKEKATATELASKTAKLDTENAGLIAERFRGDLASINTPEQLAQSIAAQYAHPVLGPIMQQRRPLLDALSSVLTTDPKEFDALKMKMSLGMKDFVDAEHKKETLAQAAATEAQNARNDLIGPDGQINPQAIEAKKQIAASGAAKTQVSVNTGQKGYENESKLRNDFKSEPIYKDYADMATAHKQIKAGIASGSPIGDVATATKIMKLLDPGSVVRESELAIAMAAGGRLDRLQNFVELQLKGEKLTPTQRKEFGALSDELMEAAGQAYNKKRAEYAEFGKNYKLDDKVLGAPYVPQPAKAAPKEGAFTDAEKEKRYQEWKAKQK
jgi:hypothetical protein